MKLVKSLLLGSAAALSTVAGAQAADLPVRKAAPVEYVQLCPAFGRGFWTIPGTDNCISIGGFARAELIVRERENDNQDLIGWRARARLNFDVRTATAFGPVRAFIRLDGNRSYGSPFAASGAGLGGTGAGSLGGTDNAPAGTMGLAQAFVQIGTGGSSYVIAGRTTSFFNPGLQGTRFNGARIDDAADNELFGYVWSTGATGFELAVSVENAVNRRTNTATFVTPFAFAPGLTNGPLVYGGQEMPDFVGRLTYKDAWGYAFVSGAVHQINDVGIAAQAAIPGTVIGFVNNNPLFPVTGTGTAAVLPRTEADDEIGFAVSGQVSLNLPFLSPGSTFVANATYANGALSYAGYGGGGIDAGGFVPGFGFSGSATAIAGLPIADAVVVNGSLETTEALSVSAGVEYVINPQWRANVYGSYSFVDYAAGAGGTALFAGQTVRTGFVDFEEGIIAGNVIYSPVAGLDIGVEVLYRAIDPRGNIVVTRQVDGGGFVRDVRGDTDNILGRFRVSRSF